jgi:hypothetical protein
LLLLFLIKYHIYLIYSYPLQSLISQNHNHLNKNNQSQINNNNNKNKKKLKWKLKITNKSNNNNKVKKWILNNEISNTFEFILNKFLNYIKIN